MTWPRESLADGVPTADGCRARVPRHRGTVSTLICTVRLKGFAGAMTVIGVTTTEVFSTHVDQVFLPEPSPGDIVVMDNLAAHHSRASLDLLGDDAIGRALGLVTEQVATGFFRRHGYPLPQAQ